MDKSRRGFLKSFSNSFEKDSDIKYIRPPYNTNPSLFESKCPECEDKPCVEACYEEIIKVLEDGSVYLDFSKRGCTYCDDCADVCQNDVLILDDIRENKLIKAHIELDITKCIAWHNVICASCSDVCYDGAIKFLGMFRPEIVYDNCTNCGFCIGVCPSVAISATPYKEIV